MRKFFRWFGYLGVFLLLSPMHLATAESLPEAGPENTGLRLRLIVSPTSHGSNETYSVRADLINVTAKPLNVSALWAYDADNGDFVDYFESALSIESEPKIVFFGIQVMMDHRTKAQPTVVIPAKGSVSVAWKSSGRRLKNKLTRPLDVMNPYFPTDGLFSVHTAFKVAVSGLGKPVLLRSNEQLVPVGGSSRAPKAASAMVMGTSQGNKQATLDRGALHGVEAGDEFLAGSGMQGLWVLRVVNIQDRRATTEITTDSRLFNSSNTPSVKPGMQAALIPQGVSGRQWMY